MSFFPCLRTYVSLILPLVGRIHLYYTQYMTTAWVYILASQPRGTLYIGVTKNLPQRIYAHKMGLFDGFTKKYNVKMLVYAEEHELVTNAIQREKSLKTWPREYKINLILQNNPNWNDLYETLNQ